MISGVDRDQLGVEHAAAVAADVDAALGHDLDGVARRRRPARQQARRTAPRRGCRREARWVRNSAFCHGGAALVGGADQQDVDGGELTCPPGSDPIEGSALVLTRRSSPGPACPRSTQEAHDAARPPHPRPRRRRPVVQPRRPGRAGGRAGRPAGRGALRRAGADSGAPAAARRCCGGPTPSARSALFSARYRNPAALVAARLGASPRDLAVSPIGGNEPQVLVNRACLDIAAGDADIVLIGGAEAWRSRSAARAGGTANRLDRAGRGRRARPGHRPRGRAEPPGRAGPRRRPADRGLPALRAGAAGRARAARSTSTCAAVGALWAGFSRGGGGQPARLDPARHAPPDEIVTATPDNRWVDLAVHEGHVRQQRRRAGRRASSCARPRGRRPWACPATAGCSRWPAPRPTTPTPSRTGSTSTPPRRAAGRAAPVRRGRPRRRRRGARRPLLVLPVGRADRRRASWASASTGS